MKKYSIVCILFLISMVIHSQNTSSSENYMQSITYKRAFSASNLHVAGQDDKLDVIHYFDGLGRIKQTISVNAGGDRQNIIGYSEYDAFGRQVKQYLPYASPTNSGYIENNALNNTLNFYNTTKYEHTLNPYLEKRYDNSPLNRVLEQAAAGNDWRLSGGKTVKSEYGANQDGEVLKFLVSLENGEPVLNLTDTYYQAGDLSKTTTKDENWTTGHKKNKTKQTFTDKQGQVLLERSFNKGKAHDTYYAYDRFGNLTYVLPPMAAEKTKVYQETSITLTASDLTTTSNSNTYATLGIRSTAPGTYEFYSDFNISPSSPSSIKTGYIADVPFAKDLELPSFFYVAYSWNSSFVGGIYSYRTTYYYIIDGKLYGATYGNSDSLWVYIDQERQLELPQNLQGYTELETEQKLQELLDKLGYRYKYDQRNRLIEKKIPGKGWEYIVYDRQNRPILTQDALQREQNKWHFVKYDAFDRVVLTGEMTSSGNRESLQNILDTSFPSNHLEQTTTSIMVDGQPVFYNYLFAYPTTTSVTLHTINYYDKYVDLPSGLSHTVTTSFQVTSRDNTSGLPTVSKTRVLQTNNWITSVTYYDAKARPIYQYTRNDYLSTTDIVEDQLDDFTGKILQTKTTHQKSGNDDLIVSDRFTYDHMDRLVTQKQQIGNQDEELIVKNHYDELGQLDKKEVGNTETTPLQEIDYTYNIRGWLKKINDPFESLGEDLFSMELHYNDYGTRLYNGNISATHWKTASDNANRRYQYSYDDLNRITRAYYYLWGESNRYSTSNISYDKNGNLLRLQRNGAIVEDPDKFTSSHFGNMDNLSYRYDGNQLLDVNDSGNKEFGFKDDDNVPVDDYDYDDNGNMIRDINKGISVITYNHLNLPTLVKFSSSDSKKIHYIYDASGVKQKKIVTTPQGTTTTHYAGNFIYQNNQLEFFNTGEGYATPNGLGEYDYIYQYKDHLDNVRLSYIKNPEFDENNMISEQVFFDTAESSAGWTGQATITTDRPRFGQKSVKIVNTANNEYKTSHSNTWVAINNSSDTEYTFSGWFYTTGPNVRIMFFMKTNQETGYFTKIDDTGVIRDQKNQWVYVEQTVVVPQDIDKINLRIETHGGDAGSVWFDDMKMVQGNPTKTLIVSESNFYPFGLLHKGYNNVVSSNGNAVAQKFKFEGVELEEALGYDSYEMDFRHYDASIGRFMVVDPMAEERNWLTPYNFVQNNPILRVDPTGLLDDYGVDQFGNVELIKKTDDNFDTLYSVTRNTESGELVKNDSGEVVRNDTNGDGKVGNGDSVTVSKYNGKDSGSILSDLAQSGLDNKIDGRKNIKSSETIARVNEAYKDDVFNVFKFAADNTMAEWSVVKYSIMPGTVDYQIGTSHQIDPDTAYSPGFNGLGTFLGMVHSHPNQPTAKDRAESLFGDKFVGRKYLRDHGRNNPYLIYFPNTGKTTRIGLPKNPASNGVTVKNGLSNFRF